MASVPENPVPATVADELPDAPLPQPEAQSQAIEIAILDGEGALNNIRLRTAREPIVQVKDRNRKPVAGALILFTINDGSSGAGATINGATTFSTVTDADGKAQTHGLIPNDVEGDFTITVTATSGALVTSVIIHQKNRAGGAGASPETTAAAPVHPTHTGIHLFPKSPLGKGILIGGIVVVAATVVVVVAVAASNGSGTRITSGTGTVGAP